MTKTIHAIRITAAATLILALILTGVATPAVQENLSAAGAAVVVYADDAVSGGAVADPAATGPAVTEPPTPGPAPAPKKDIAGVQIAAVKKQVYTGKAIKPSPKVTLNGKTLKKNKAYTISYKKNKLPGTATLTIKGKAPNYKGKKSITFKIAIPKPVGFKLKTTQDSVKALWKEAPGKITGYKVYYAKNAKFTSTKKVKDLIDAKAVFYAIDRPLFARSFYVKVRAYVKVGKKTYYSDYTKVKKKKTTDVSWFKKASASIGKKTKWIETDLSKQIVYLHIGKKKVVKTYAVSTGKPSTPTIKGTFRVYKKDPLHDMKGDWNPETEEWGYIAKNVPWTTYFIRGYAFHGAPWNGQVYIPVDEPRQTRSHGCVNMRVQDAKYIYDWAPSGTLVIVHK